MKQHHGSERTAPNPRDGSLNQKTDTGGGRNDVRADTQERSTTQEAKDADNRRDRPQRRD